MSATETTNGKVDDAKKVTPAKKVRAIEDFVAANGLKSLSGEDDPIDALMHLALQAKGELPELERTVSEQAATLADLRAELLGGEEELLEVLPVDSYRDAVKFLRRPFTPQAVKFKVQATWRGGGLVVSYIDARLVIERLNLVCPDLWSARYEQVAGGSMRCYLTVGTRADGVPLERSDVGEGVGKGLNSDALKRAAVQFGIGVSLYAVPQMRLWVDNGHLEVKGDKTYLTPNGETHCRDLYSAWLESGGTKAFGQPLDHGDAGEAQGDIEVDEGAEEKPPAPAASQAAPPAAATAEPVKPPEEHIATLLAEDGPLKERRWQANAGMEALGAGPQQRLRELTSNTTEVALDALLTRINNAADDEEEG